MMAITINGLSPCLNFRRRSVAVHFDWFLFLGNHLVEVICSRSSKLSPGQGDLLNLIPHGRGDMLELIPPGRANLLKFIPHGRGDLLNLIEITTWSRWSAHGLKITTYSRWSAQPFAHFYLKEIMITLFNSPNTCDYLILK